MITKDKSGAFRFGITTIVRKELKMSMNKFCENELKTDYRTFLARLNKGNLYPSEIIYIVWRTKKSVKELFDKDWQDLMISSQGGALAETVKSLMKKWGIDEKGQVLDLMGIELEITPKKKEQEEYVQPVVKKEEIKEEVKKELKDLFEETY